MSNVYPHVAPAAVESLETILSPKETDSWDTSPASYQDTSDLDKDIYEAAAELASGGLLSEPTSKEDVDDRFGRGN